jgi:hypothetical protein
VTTSVPGFQPFDGTSAADPHTAAIAALLLSGKPAATPAHIRWALVSSALDLGAPRFGTVSGHGMVMPGRRDIAEYTADLRSQLGRLFASDLLSFRVRARLGPELRMCVSATGDANSPGLSGHDRPRTCSASNGPAGRSTTPGGPRER